MNEQAKTENWKRSHVKDACYAAKFSVSEREAWAYAVEAQGFAGDMRAWLDLSLDERAEYELGAQGIGTE